MTTRRNAKIPRRADGDVPSKKEKFKNVSNIEEDIAISTVDLTYDVLTIIFKNLNAKDLCNAARVCRTWSEAAANEKRRRGGTVFTLLGDLNDSWNDLWHDRPLIDYLRTKPILSLMFTRPFDKKHPALKADLADCPCRILPSKCPHLTVGNYAIAKDNLETEEPLKAVFALLPKDEGIVINTVYVPLTEQTRPKGPPPRIPDYFDIYGHSRFKTLRELANPKKKISCFVLFTSEEFRNGSAILENMPRVSRRTLAGGVASNLTLCDRDESGTFCSKPLAWIAMSISGHSVRTFTAVLRITCHTKGQVERKLRKLRQKVTLSKHSVGFMFACQGRGEYMFREASVESTIFRKIFPEVPLIGCSGGGEYGECHVGKMANRVHQYSTVFMILTYGQS